MVASIHGGELRKRLVTAFFLILVVIVLIALAAFSDVFQIIFSSIAFLVVLLGVWEFTTFCRFRYQNVSEGRLLLFVTILPVFTVFSSLVSIFFWHKHLFYQQTAAISSVPLAAASLGAVLSGGVLLRGLNRAPYVVRHLADELFAGVVLFACGASSLVAISFYWEITVWLLVIVAVNDSAAYFVGRAWGRRKLAPQTSPGKTVIGSIAGLLVGMVTAALLPRLFYLEPFFTADQSLLVRTILSVVLSFFCILAAQMADLLKSHCKRIHSVKDSGTILPGHGGVLDRIDGLLGGAIIVVVGVSVLSVLRALSL